MPKPPTIPKPEWWDALATPSEESLLRAGLKRVILGQRRLERQLAEALRPGGNNAFEVQTFEPPGAAAPRISVALTVYNYADTLEDALESVALADADTVELVVIDDASTDGSAQVVERILRDELPWLRAQLIRRTHNAGLPAARNLAIARASGEYVFILDADNSVYPHAFERLEEALDVDPDASFAYGILEKFDARGPFDLMSWISWQPERFQYGNYIDAMTMIRRTALEKVGGYTTDERLYGWEDFALWCAFAQAGMRGVQVAEILGRYRANPSSMIALTNIDTSDAWGVLIERFPFLLAGDRDSPANQPSRLP